MELIAQNLFTFTISPVVLIVAAVCVTLAIVIPSICKTLDVEVVHDDMSTEPVQAPKTRKSKTTD